MPFEHGSEGNRSGAVEQGERPAKGRPAPPKDVPCPVCGGARQLECRGGYVVPCGRCLEFLQLPASPYLWADKSAPARGRRFYRAVVLAAPTNLVFIPPGTFNMGSPTNEPDREDREAQQTAATISRGFWMGKYEVTQREYQAVIGGNPSWFNGDRTTAGEGVEG
jgi:formylglycine-generating enzyme required for sulfatase activity